MSVSTRTVSTELAQQWMAQLSKRLAKAGVPAAQTPIAMAVAWGLKTPAALSQRKAEYPHDATPIALAMVKDWAKHTHKTLKRQTPGLALSTVQDGWAQLFGASNWNGLPFKLDAFNAQRRNAREEATREPDHEPLEPNDWLVIDGTVLAQAKAVAWDEDQEAWSVLWLGRAFDGKSSRQKGEVRVRQVDRIKAPKFPLDAHAALADQVTVLPLRNDRRAREQELTAAAIDWAMSCVEDLFEGSQGDAAAATDVAVEATYRSLGEGDEDQSWIDAEQVEAALVSVFEELEAEALEAEALEAENDEEEEEDDDMPSVDDMMKVFNWVNAATRGRVNR